MNFRIFRNRLRLIEMMIEGSIWLMIDTNETFRRYGELELFPPMIWWILQLGLIVPNLGKKNLIFFRSIMILCFEMEFEIILLKNVERTLWNAQKWSSIFLTERI